MKNTTFLQVILVVALVMTVNVQSGLAQFQPPPNPLTCFSNLDGVRGCIKQLSSATSSGKTDNVAPACCKIVKGTSDFCMLLLFPNPTYRFLLKTVCSFVKDPPAPAPAPAQTPAAPSTPPPPPSSQTPASPSQPSPSQPSSQAPSSPSQPSPSQPSSQAPSSASQPSSPSPAAPAPKAQSAPAPSG